MWRAATAPIQYVAILSLVLFFSLVAFLLPVGLDDSLSLGYSIADASVVEDFQKALVYPIYLLLAALVSMIGGMLALVGYGFDQAILYTIVNFSSFTFTAALSEGIDAVWGGFRDIANILMISMYVYLAFLVILNLSSYGLKSLAIRILMIALLINFSLFFTKVVIDLSNSTATQFRKAIQVKTVGGDDGNIAQIFFNKSGISDLSYGAALGTIEDIGDKTGLGKVFLYSFIVMIFYSALLAVLLFGMILLVTRMVVFLVLMMTASLAFAAYLVPKHGDKWWNMWWNSLIKHALFAPLLMLMLWATVRVTNTMGGAGADSFSELLSNPDASKLTPILELMVVVGLLYASIKIASELSLKGSALAKDIGMRGMSAGLRVGAEGTVGLTGRALRNTIGRGAQSMSQDKERLARANSSNAITRLGARATLAATSALGGSSFDARNIKGVKSGLAKASIDIGTGTANYQAGIDKVHKREKAYAKDAFKAQSDSKTTRTAAAAAPVRNERGDQYVPPEGQQTNENAANLAREDNRIEDARERIDEERTERGTGEEPTSRAPERDINVNNVNRPTPPTPAEEYRSRDSTTKTGRFMDRLVGRDVNRHGRIVDDLDKESKKSDGEKSRNKREKQMEDLEKNVRKLNTN